MSFLFSGEILGVYRLVKPVKCAENSEVWIAVDGGGKYGILKALRSGSPDSERMLAIARAISGVDCGGIVKILDSGVSESGAAYVLTPYMGGGSLAGLLAKCGRLSLGRTARVLCGVLGGLAEVHGLGIVHRDVKPANIWISEDGLACLGDFGIAKIPGYSDSEASVFGTAAYMSPEQAIETSRATPASDLFSLGCVAYECLTGRRRYPQKGFAETLKAVISDCGASVGELEEFATHALAKLLCKMMDPSPAMRPPSAESVLREIESMGLPDEPLTWR